MYNVLSTIPALGKGQGCGKHVVKRPRSQSKSSAGSSQLSPMRTRNYSKCPPRLLPHCSILGVSNKRYDFQKHLHVDF